MNGFHIFLMCWASGLVGFALGCAWRWLFKESTDLELREAHHTRVEETSEYIRED